MIKAAIFDLDGTLINSMMLHYEAFKHTVEEFYNLDYPQNAFEPHYGKTAEEIITPFLKSNKLDETSAHDFAVRRREVLIEVLEEMDSIPLLDGAFEILQDFKDRGTPLALATSNRKRSGQLMVEKSGLSHFFPIQIYFDDVGVGKPEPDIFLEASTRLGLIPRKCVVFEDSIFGVRAAKKPQMIVVALPTGTHSKKDLEVERPDFILSSLSDFQIGLLK